MEKNLYIWIILLYTWNIVNQLYFNKKDETTNIINIWR